MTSISLGGAILLLASVVVLTMLTQAFAFEAIRVLEGYWGTSRLASRVSRWRCKKWSARRVDLDEAYQNLLTVAWQGARSRISSKQAKRTANGQEVIYTPDMMEVVEAALMGRRPSVTLSPAQTDKAFRMPWQPDADADLLREMISVDKQRLDFPVARRVLPTRFGCVMRRWEDATGVPDLESWVQDNFEALPPSLRQSHNEQRTRLDLYSSMVFVMALIAVIGLARMLPGHVGFAVGVAVASLLGACVSYWSAVASARAYGSVLVSIARCLQPSTPSEDQPA